MHVHKESKMDTSGRNFAEIHKGITKIIDIEWKRVREEVNLMSNKNNREVIVALPRTCRPEPAAEVNRLVKYCEKKALSFHLDCVQWGARTLIEKVLRRK